MPYTDEIFRSIGALQGTVATGFHEVHRRMSIHDQLDMDRHREVLGYIHHLNYRVDRSKKVGNGIPYAKIATILGLIILGTLGHIAPDAVRSAIAKILLTQMGG